jgi:hypothetical protein
MNVEVAQLIGFEADYRRQFGERTSMDGSTQRTNVNGLTDRIPRHTRWDTRLGWRVGQFADRSVTGQNLLTPRHREFSNSQQVHSTQAPHGGVGKPTWHF